MFNEFLFEALSDQEFKEDSVREELVAPIIRRLGYGLTGDNRVVRSRSLVHPYVAIGSQRRKVSIVPDYLFLSKGKPFWVLDAKAPTERLVNSEHTEQAYSYAIHPEVRAEMFALCNGHRFTLFSIRQFEPLLDFGLRDIDVYWDKLYRILNPEIRANPESVQYHPDFGLHLRRLGVEPGFKLILMAVNSNTVAKVRDGLYTSITVIGLPEDQYAVSLDFDDAQLKQLLTVLPEDQVRDLGEALTTQPYMIRLEEGDFRFRVAAELAEEILHNAEESYVPFNVLEFGRYGDTGES